MSSKMPFHSSADLEPGTEWRTRYASQGRRTVVIVNNWGFLPKAREGMPLDEYEQWTITTKNVETGEIRSHSLKSFLIRYTRTHKE